MEMENPECSSTETIENMFKTRGVTSGNHTKRPSLRSDARKLICDTVCLFESNADLGEIRKEAGFQDPSQNPSVDEIMALKSTMEAQAAFVPQLRDNEREDIYTQLPVRKSKFGEQMQQTLKTWPGMELAEENKMKLEYWLKSTADLGEIMTKAGIQDPSQDPICAAMFKELWDEADNLKKREKKSKQPEQALAMVTTTSSPLVTCMDRDQAYTSVIQQKDQYTILAVRNSKLGEQLQQASQTFSGIEDKIMALKSTMEAQLLALMYYSEAADDPQLRDNERGVSSDATKVRRLRRMICRPQRTFLSEVPTTYSVLVTPSSKPAMPPLDLVRTQCPFAPSPGSSSRRLKGTTAIARIGAHHIYMASDQRESYPNYEIDGIHYPGYVHSDTLVKLEMINVAIICVGVGWTDTCQRFISEAVAVDSRIFGGSVACGGRVLIAVKSLMKYIHNWEVATGVVCNEEFLVSGFYYGEPIIYKVRSKFQGGVEYGTGVGATMVIGSGSAAACEFLISAQCSGLDDAAMVESTIVVASIKDSGTGGHVHKARIPIGGNQAPIFEIPISVLDLLQRDFPKYGQLLQLSLFFLCDGLDYTREKDSLLLHVLAHYFPGSRTHVISRQSDIIRMITFAQVMDYKEAWEEVKHGFVCGQYRLSFFEPTQDNTRLLRFFEKF